MKDENIEINERIKSMILLQIGMKYGNRHVNAGHIKGYCSQFMNMILEWDEANELAEEYNSAA